MTPITAVATADESCPEFAAHLPPRDTDREIGEAHARTALAVLTDQCATPGDMERAAHMLRLAGKRAERCAETMRARACGAK